MNQKESSVLGIFVTDAAVEGVLLRRTEDQKVHVVGRYVKQRSRRGERIADLAAVIPGLREATASDYTMEVGDGSGASEADIFLSGEFQTLGVAKSENGKPETRQRRDTIPFGTQLKEILAECKSGGYPAPELAFCLGSSEIVYHELGLPIPRERQAAVGSTKIGGGVTKGQRRVLLQKLAESMPAAMDKARTAFVPMTDDQNRWRFFAVVPFAPDPVGEALDIVARRTRAAVPAAHVVDSEVTLLLGLVRCRAESRTGRVGIVRVGPTDTTILFLDDGRLDRYEHLRSLTSYDPVDTVCSRVLLKQDELRIGTIDRLYVATDHQGDNAVDTFQSYFPDSEVHNLADLLEAHNLAAGDKMSAIRAQTLPAIGVGLRLLEKWSDDEHRGALVNLLEKRRRGIRARRIAPVKWHTYFLAAVLFVVALLYTWSYMGQKEQIDRREAEVALNPPQFPTEDPALLRARVDSLQATYTRYNRALTVLDSLLVGSDMWSTTLERMTQSTRDIGNIWLKAWTPEGVALRVEGNALQRSNIAMLAQRWSASIDKLTFAEIQGIRVYSFSMTVPVTPQLPRVAQYLRDNSLQELDPREAEALAGMGDAAGHTHSN